MIQQLQTTYKARIVGSKIVLSAGYSEELVEFYRSLPSSRWDRKSRTWSCRLTSAAAWRVMCREEFGPTSLSPELQDIAMRFWGATLEADQFADAANAPAIPQPASVKTPMWSHQLRAFGFARRLNGVEIAQDMGTGKSLVVVALVGYWACKTILVLCPKAVIGVWRREFDRHAAYPIDVLCLDEGTGKQRAARAQEFLGRPRASAAALVGSYEWAREYGPIVFGGNWDVVICDESHKIASHNSLQSTMVAKLTARAKRRLCLTGTPLTQSPLSIFGQFRFLDPGIFGTSWTQFSQRYAVYGNPHVPQMVTGYKNQEELQARMKLITFRCKAEDVLDLPEKHHVDRRFKLSKSAMKVYTALEEEMIVEVGGGVCTATNALVKMLRLSQVTSGYLPIDDSNELREIDTAKIEVLQEILEDLPEREPVVVFCRFTQDIARIRQLAEKLGRRYGEQSGQRRDALDARAMMRQDIDVAAVQIASGGSGVDLTRANVCCYYSIGRSLTEYGQSMARLHRPGQTRRVTYFHLIAEGTVDVIAYKALARKQEIIDAVLSVFNQRSS